MDNKKKATFAVMVGGALAGITNIFSKFLAAGGLGSMQISGVRTLIAAIGIIIWMLIKDRSKFKVDPKDLWLFALNGFNICLVFNFFYINTVIRGQASVAVILLYTSPIFVMLLAAILFKEKLTWRKLLSLAMTVTGCLLVTGFLGQQTSIPPLILFTGLMSALCYAGYNLLTHYTSRKYDTWTITIYVMLFGSIFILPFADLPGTMEILKADPKLIWSVLGIAILCNLMTCILFSWGLTYLESGTVAIISATEPVVGTIAGIVLFHESHGIAKIIGVAMVISGIIILGTEKKPTVKE